jgi:hypothetical protein
MLVPDMMPNTRLFFISVMAQMAYLFPHNRLQTASRCGARF